jgi:uncharacterized protein YxjI
MAAPPQLKPFPRQLGRFQQFVARGTETLILKEKVMSLSGDSFDIKTVTGQPIFKIEGRHMTVSGRKTVRDVQGNHLFDIVKELLHIHATYVAEDPQKNHIMEIKSSFKLIGSKAKIEFKTFDGSTVNLVMSGNWFDTYADIVDEATGAVAARIDRQVLNKREIFGGQQTYALVVAPGVDMALMVAACVAMDEKNNDK